MIRILVRDDSDGTWHALGADPSAVRVELSPQPDAPPAVRATLWARDGYLSVQVDPTGNPYHHELQLDEVVVNGSQARLRVRA